jgi:hypothetical protein
MSPAQLGFALNRRSGLRAGFGLDECIGLLSPIDAGCSSRESGSIQVRNVVVKLGPISPETWVSKWGT